MLAYKITRKYAKGAEQLFASFDKPDEAKKYIGFKLDEDADLRVNIMYSLYELGELIGTFNQDSSQETPGGSVSQTSTHAARISPLQTAPRPAGMPLSSFNNMDDDKK